MGHAAVGRSPVTESPKYLNAVIGPSAASLGEAVVARTKEPNGMTVRAPVAETAAAPTEEDTTVVP